MKLEVGMYIRTKYGIITKIIDNRDNVIIKTDDYTTHLRSEVIKASNNVIDLIEVGDIITYEFPTGLGILKYENVTVLENLLDILKNSDEYTILSIVTKEQFESMSYKVGD